MTRAEFLRRLAADPRFQSRRQAADALDAILESIAAALGEGEEVSLTGFGKFHVVERPPRPGVNPRTGERMTIAGGPAARFRAGSALKAGLRQRGRRS
ncbi:MAG: DNA-binding protein HU-beta [Solirubrobacterales bacterium]|nr:DNA-binding protein HU-beta [Solirubrobacterales bacterium]MDX6663598.1 DNA-binding protein HU-beta [Solirubrobacterales bacterium]